MLPLSRVTGRAGVCVRSTTWGALVVLRLVVGGAGVIGHYVHLLQRFVLRAGQLMKRRPQAIRQVLNGAAISRAADVSVEAAACTTPGMQNAVLPCCAACMTGGQTCSRPGQADQACTEELVEFAQAARAAFAHLLKDVYMLELGLSGLLALHVMYNFGESMSRAHGSLCKHELSSARRAHAEPLVQEARRAIQDDCCLVG